MQSQRVEQIKAEAVEWLVMLKDPDLDPNSPFPTRKALWTAFTEWYTQSPEHLAAFIETSEIDVAVRRIDSERVIDVEELRREPLDNVVRLGVPQTRHTRSGARTSRRRWSIAVSAVAGLLIGLTVRSSGAWPTHYTTKIGERTFVPLEDRSTMELNTRTRVVVSYGLHSRQITVLSGEAIFDVRRDAERPFRVISGDIVIQDVGTKFDVYRHPDGTTSVTVLEGIVDITTAGTSKRVGAAQSVTIASQRARTRHALFHVENLSQQEIARRLSWKAGLLTFEGETVAQAIEEVNRYNPQQLSIRDPKLATKKLGGVFGAVDLDSFVSDLEVTLGLRAVMAPDNPNVIELRLKKDDR